jgi:hypothetical protein
MAPSQGSTLRLVIQRICLPHISCYRLVAYGDGQAYQPVDFDSLGQLVERLRSVAPNFNATILPEANAHTSILFSGNIELDDSQILRLGLSQETP